MSFQTIEAMKIKMNSNLKFANFFYVHRSPGFFIVLRKPVKSILSHQTNELFNWRSSTILVACILKLNDMMNEFEEIFFAFSAQTYIVTYIDTMHIHIRTCNIHTNNKKMNKTWKSVRCKENHKIRNGFELDKKRTRDQNPKRKLKQSDIYIEILRLYVETIIEYIPNWE